MLSFILRLTSQMMILPTSSRPCTLSCLWWFRCTLNSALHRAHSVHLHAIWVVSLGLCMTAHALGCSLAGCSAVRVDWRHWVGVKHSYISSYIPTYDERDTSFYSPIHIPIYYYIFLDMFKHSYIFLHIPRCSYIFVYILIYPIYSPIHSSIFSYICIYMYIFLCIPT